MRGVSLTENVVVGKMLLITWETCGKPFLSCFTTGIFSFGIFVLGDDSLPEC